jgi:hypothetical protein
MPSSKARQQRRRRELYVSQRGLCYWCGEPMIYLDKIDMNDHRPRLCTLEHLRTRANPTRQEQTTFGESRYAAACRECNRLRADGRVNQMKPFGATP